MLGDVARIPASLDTPDIPGEPWKQPAPRADQSLAKFMQAMTDVLGPGAIKAEKTRPGSTRMVFLGVTVDLLTWTLECPAARLAALREELRSDQWFDRSSTLLARQRLHGRLRHVAYVRPLLWPLVSVLVLLLGTGGVAGAYGCSPAEAWERFLDALQCVRVILDEPLWSAGASLAAPIAYALSHAKRMALTPPHLVHRLGSDASLTQGAAVNWTTGEYFVVTWSPDELRMVRHLWDDVPNPDSFTIATIELVMVHFAALRWGSAWADPGGQVTTVIAANDNTNAV